MVKFCPNINYFELRTFPKSLRQIWKFRKMLLEKKYPVFSSFFGSFFGFWFDFSFTFRFTSLFFSDFASFLANLEWDIRGGKVFGSIFFGREVGIARRTAGFCSLRSDSFLAVLKNTIHQRVKLCSEENYRQKRAHRVLITSLLLKKVRKKWNFVILRCYQRKIRDFSVLGAPRIEESHFKGFAQCNPFLEISRGNTWGGWFF